MQPSLSPTDEEVVRRVLGGETRLFALLVQRYSPALHRTARAILRSDADAEEVVQQAYLNAYRHLHTFEGRATFSTWLTRIVIYAALARRRRNRAQPTESAGFLSDRILSSTIDPERQAYVAELGRLLVSAIDALPENYRSVFTLREVDGLSTTEAATRLRVSEAAIKTRLHRAKGELKRSLAASVRAARVSSVAERSVGGRPSRISDCSVSASL